LPSAGRVAVWDWPVRLVHWSLVPLVAFSWWSAEYGDMQWHIRSGLAIFVLLVFRLIWGLVGSSTARFGQFVRGPGAVLGYLRGKVAAPLGHSPLGALSVVALLLVLSAQVGLGLVASDTDGLDAGPLSHLVSWDAAEWAGDTHETLFNAVLALVALHIAAIVYYLARRQNLVTPMLTGSKPGDGEGLRPAPAWRAFAALAVALALGWATSTGFRFLA
jgi:cytochrome b